MLTQINHDRIGAIHCALQTEKAGHESRNDQANRLHHSQIDHYLVAGLATHGPIPAHCDEAWEIYELEAFFSHLV